MMVAGYWLLVAGLLVWLLFPAPVTSNQQLQSNASIKLG
jgi:hypothetical protein